MTTKVSVKNTRLPSAPMDFCPAIEVADFLAKMTMSDETTWSAVANVTMTTMTSLASSMNTTENVIQEIEEPTGFRRLFMLSYQWFGSIGILQVIIVGTIISLCTGYKRPGEVNRKYLIPFYDSLFPFLSESVLRPLRCGYHFENEVEEDDEERDAVYNKVDSKDIDVFKADLSIKEKTGITDKQPETSNHVLDNGKAISADNINTDETIAMETFNESDVFIAVSIDVSTTKCQGQRDKYI